MADIHILTTPIQGNERIVNVLYHVPIDQNDPPYNYKGGQVSEIESHLDQTEIDKLANGSLREVKKAPRFQKDVTITEILETCGLRGRT